MYDNAPLALGTFDTIGVNPERAALVDEICDAADVAIHAMFNRIHRVAVAPAAGSVAVQQAVAKN